MTPFQVYHRSIKRLLEDADENLGREEYRVLLETVQIELVDRLDRAARSDARAVDRFVAG